VHSHPTTRRALEEALAYIHIAEAATYRNRAKAMLKAQFPKVIAAVAKLSRSRFSVTARLNFRARISGMLRRSAHKIAQLGWEAGGGSGKIPATMVRQYTQRQQQHLIGWHKQIRATRGIPGGAGRAKMYVNSLMGLYNESWALAQELLGMPKLPAVPRDGSTLCIVGCECHWSKLKKVNPVTYVAYWKLGMAEHCPTCMCRAKHWNPLTFTNVGGQWVQRISGGSPTCVLVA